MRSCKPAGQTMEEVAELLVRALLFHQPSISENIWTTEGHAADWVACP